METPIEDGLVVMAQDQQEGRGQQQATWQSKAGKSLTFSLFKRFSGLPVVQQTTLNFAISVGLFEALRELNVPQLAIKWPNDILSHQHKLAGILIENQVKGNELVSSIIGIGLNVNEDSFHNLPKAISMKLATGREFSIDAVCRHIVQHLLKRLALLDAHTQYPFKSSYEEHLFRKNKVSVFENAQGDKKNGIILGVTNSGNLLVAHGTDTPVAYGVKEVQLLY